MRCGQRGLLVGGATDRNAAAASQHSSSDEWTLHGAKCEPDSAVFCEQWVKLLLPWQQTHLNELEQSADSS